MLGAARAQSTQPGRPFLGPNLQSGHRRKALQRSASFGRLPNASGTRSSPCIAMPASRRRAMIGQQTFEGRRDNLAQANKLSRTYATLVEALNRHCGKGQQKVTVEHVHVHAGGQAVVGVIAPPGGGDQSKSKDRPHAKQISHAPQLPMRSADQEWERMPIAGDAKRPLQDARRNVTGRTEGK